MVRGRDACWEHCVLVDATRQKVRCNYCQREFSGGVYRMKFHLAQIKNKDIVPCAQVPDDVRSQIQILLRTPKKQKPPKKQQKLELPINDQDHNTTSSASSGARINNGSSSHNGSTCPARSCPDGQLATDDPRKQKWENADKKIAEFFIQNSIHFAAAKSNCYKEMVDSVAECGIGYIPPSYDKMRSSLLDKLKADVNNYYNKLREEWRETGCTLLCECSIGRPRSLVAFSVTSAKGTVFLKSVDVSSRSDDAHYLFELIESVVLEIGVEFVVQVLTDCNASYIYAGRLLIAKYPSLFWHPCASNCINKILEDLSKKEWVSNVLEEASTIVRYIYSHTWTRNTMRKFTGGAELTRPNNFTFVSKFLSLRAIVIQEDNLKNMFSTNDAQGIKTVLPSDRFWKSAHEVVSVTEPLLKILRMVDGDMPAMGYIYGKMERAKIAIKAYYKGLEEKYIEIWDIIDNRWNVQVHSPLHAAAAFLNPSCFYSNKIDTRMRNGFQETMLRMAKEDRDKSEITKEHPVYVNAQGALSTEFAIMGRTLNAPGDWWAVYGYEIPTLQRTAIRILSQPCSSHWCKWSWSTFESVHSKKRNKMEAEKFSDLVYVHCNLWLQAISRSRDSKCRPVNFDEIDVTFEWPVESESSIPLFDDSWLENLPLESS